MVKHSPKILTSEEKTTTYQWWSIKQMANFHILVSFKSLLGQSSVALRVMNLGTKNRCLISTCFSVSSHPQFTSDSPVLFLTWPAVHLRQPCTVLDMTSETPPKKWLIPKWYYNLLLQATQTNHVTRNKVLHCLHDRRQIKCARVPHILHHSYSST